jgi:hypothetical protein
MWICPKPQPCISQHTNPYKGNVSIPLMKAHRGSGGVASLTFNFGTNDDEGSVPRLTRVTLWEKAPGTHWIAVWVGPRAGLGVYEKRNTSWLCRDLNPGSFSPQPCHYTEVIQTPIHKSTHAMTTETLNSGHRQKFICTLQTSSYIFKYMWHRNYCAMHK